MRKGYTIHEMLGLLGILVLVFMLMREPIRILISDIPRQNRDFQTATSMNQLFNRLKLDIEAAKELKTTSEPNTLMIIGDTETLTYHFDPNQVRRVSMNDPNENNSWSLPYSRLVWEVNNSSSIQITGWMERTVLGLKEKKFHNSHLYYAKRFECGEAQ